MAPFPTPVIHSMETLNKDLPLRQLYPENIYPNGDYYPSPYGRVRYWIVGPEDGKKVVLIHAMSIPSIVWKDIQAELVSNGFRVLMYDVYGRGYTEAPRLACDPNLCIMQLALLLQYLRWDAADVVGFSMGGAIAASFAAMFPHLVNKNIVFLPAAGLMEARAQTPDKEPLNTSREVQLDSAQIAIYLREQQSQHLPGFNDVLQSTLNDGLITGVQWAYQKLGSMTEKHFLIVHGTADNVVPYSEAVKIHKLIPQAQLVPLEDASHFVPLEEGSWQKFVDSLVNFLM
ncbi:uncharacterized protein PHACADRAFT_181109 [Phanerochaete carnosa HHB-10118-sp]|uniref:AB hydrolase-1 domain-containing protein n=1 Tax=Phanerochaete carnosa (strain HHB-10118-sp) TaxID=650164 RepID=K5WIA3_PHACS|nr:uncharacterized protein PHACADRAFT_181109 [Phanerochaete carnosa HHB-10118-sp]EKM59105.1 hypothetical protein PHACADRAFT_181109 [Phanerochaete carnosa HHB-10118-sp]